MPLATGTRLGPYEVLAPIGAGGMGEVYRARDNKLGRDVAIKVLPESFVHDTERLARFEREAQVLASLNHPHIATIHGLEESGGVRALVMELVEGPTLAERIGGRAMPPDEALPIAKQIAEGLEYAHEKGVVHRDLKPANVKLTADGNVKILDFGLAKALEAPAPAGNPSISPTLMLSATQAGVILGTAAYMAPEQARGAVVDKRADIWAYGVVLYEMLTGKQPFAGETVSDTLAAVLRAEPQWDAIPVGMRRLVRRCLEKNPKRRLRDIGEARVVIEDLLAGSAEEQLVAAPPEYSWLLRLSPWLAAALLQTASCPIVSNLKEKNRSAGRAPGFCALRRGQGLPPLFPAPLSPLAASFLRYATDRFLLTKPNTSCKNRGASVATLRWCSGSSRNAVRLPFGISVQLRRNPHTCRIWRIRPKYQPKAQVPLEAAELQKHGAL